MSYATQIQLTERFGERMLVGLTDRGDVATGTVDASVVSRALEDTDAVIDGYLAGRYALPLVEVPRLVTDIAMTIAIYKLHVAAPDPKIEADYKGALQMLLQIGRGDIRLSAEGGDLPGASEAASGTGVRFTDRERPFTEQNLKGFI